MCLIAFALDPNSHRPFVMLSNRDEFWHRPTEPLTDWVLPGGTRVHGGRDVEAGGTWVGFGQQGRVAMVTNVRRWPPESAPRSRGGLATGWLDSRLGWEAWLAEYPAAAYGGVNLVLGAVAPHKIGTDTTGQHWVWLTNREPEDATQAERLAPGWWGRALGPGLYGLSNAALDTPWPKTLAFKSALAQALPAWDTRPLVDAMLDTREAPLASLPQTGVPPALERHLSAAFVHDPERGYGTRSSLIAVADHTGLRLQEWTHNVQTHPMPHHNRPPAWPVAHSVYRERSISTWGMPTSS